MNPSRQVRSRWWRDFASLASLALWITLATLPPIACADSTPVASPDSGTVRSIEPSTAARPAFGHRNVPTWPIYVRWDTPAGWSWRWFGPVTVTSRGPGYGAEYPVFPAIGARRWGDGRREWRLLWPLTYSESQSSPQRWRVNLVTPLVSVAREWSPDARRLVLLPIFERTQMASGYRRFELAPLYSVIDDPSNQKHQTDFLFPPWLAHQGVSGFRRWRSTEGRGWQSMALYGGVETASEKRLSLPPWVSIERFDRGRTLSRVRVLAPLYARWSGWESRGVQWGPYVARERLQGRGAPSRFQTLVPVFGAWRDSTRSLAFVLPSWWRQRGPERVSEGLLPLYARWRGPETMGLQLGPYIGRKRVRGAGAPTGFEALVPVYGSWRDSSRSVAVVLPLWWRYRSPRLVTDGLWPLYARFSRTRADSSRHSGTSFAWPLVTWGSGDRYSAFGVLPLVYHVRDGDTRLTMVTPLLFDFRRPDRDALVVAPIYGRFRHGASRLTLALPFYAGYRDPTRETRVLLPVHMFNRSPSNSTVVWGPYYRWSGPTRRGWGLAGLYDSAEGEGYGYRWALPGYLHSWTAERDTRWLLLYAELRSRRDQSYTKMLGPVLWSGGPGTSGYGVVPLLFHGRRGDWSSTLAGPVFWSGGGSATSHAVVFPLAWYRRNPRNWAIDLLPLSGYHSSADGHSLLYVAGPLLVRQVQGPQRRSTSVLWWLYRDDTRGPVRRTFLQPVFFRERKSQDDLYVSSLGGLLFSYERIRNERELRICFIPVRHWSR